MRILFTQLAGHGARNRERFRVYACRDAARRERRQNSFGGNVADHVIAGERTPAETGKSAIETPASHFVCRENFGDSVFRAAMQMYADFDTGHAIFHGAVHMRDVQRAGQPNCIRQRDCAHAGILQPYERVLDDFRSPRLVVRIAEGHRNIDYELAAGSFRLALQLFDQRTRFVARHICIGAPEVCRNRVRVADRRHARSGERTFEALLVHDDADDVGCLARRQLYLAQLLHHIFAIRHLRNVLGRDEAHRVNVAKTELYQLREVPNFLGGRNRFV